MGFFKARCKLSLLNLDVLEFEIGSKQTADTILLAANEKLNISEENYDCFALYYLDAENQVQWVNPMDTVVNILAQRDSSGHILLFHGVRFFPLSCLSVVDPNTVIQFFFDTRLQFVKGYLSMEFDDFTTCSAILILHKCGIESLEYSEVSRVFDEELAFPKLLLRQFEANVDQIHDEVYDKCLSFKNATHAQLIATFLKHCQNSALFGSVFYKFTDSVNHDIVLAVNSRSVLQFDPKNIYQPKKVFNFALVDDITCSEASLVISVRGERDEPYAAAFLKKATFKFQSTQVCKKIWSAIVAQHKYYRSQIAETSHQGSEYSLQLLTDRLSQFFASSSTIASSGPSNSSLGSTRSYSTTSMKSRVSDVTVDQPLTSYQRTKEEKERDLQSYYKLKGEVKLIEDELLYKLEELKQLCVEEANITGDMPKEIFMTLLPGESMPNTTKRMGTAFKLDRDVIPTSNFVSLFSI